MNINCFCCKIDDNTPRHIIYGSIKCAIGVLFLAILVTSARLWPVWPSLYWLFGIIPGVIFGPSLVIAGAYQIKKGEEQARGWNCNNIQPSNQVWVYFILTQDSWGSCKIRPSFLIGFRIYFTHQVDSLFLEHGIHSEVFVS